MAEPFKPGNKVHMPGVPIVVEVLAVSTCTGEDGCGKETFQFADPESGKLDWAHSFEFKHL